MVMSGNSSGDRTALKAVAGAGSYSHVDKDSSADCSMSVVGCARQLRWVLVHTVKLGLSSWQTPIVLST